MLTCTNHCSQCGRHFHSLEAFDLHLDHATGWPVCLDPVDLEDRDGRSRLVELGRGKCRMYPPGVERDVAIWTDARRLEAARQHFRKGPKSSPEADRGDHSPNPGGTKGKTALAPPLAETVPVDAAGYPL